MSEDQKNNMSSYKDADGTKIKMGQNEQGQNRADRYTDAPDSSRGHTHDFSKTDHSSGEHIEGSHGENAPETKGVQTDTETYGSVLRETSDQESSQT